MPKELTALSEPMAGVRAPAPEPDRLTPAELAELTGNVTAARAGIRLNGASPEPAYSWQHEAASQLHGWKQHEHDAGEPLRMTRDDYEAALKAASEPVTRNGRTDYEPHRAALSQYAPAAKDKR